MYSTVTFWLKIIVCTTGFPTMQECESIYTVVAQLSYAIMIVQYSSMAGTGWNQGFPTMRSLTVYENENILSMEIKKQK